MKRLGYIYYVMCAMQLGAKGDGCIDDYGTKTGEMI